MAFWYDDSLFHFSSQSLLSGGPIPSDPNGKQNANRSGGVHSFLLDASIFVKFFLSPISLFLCVPFWIFFCSAFFLYQNFDHDFDLRTMHEHFACCNLQSTPVAEIHKINDAVQAMNIESKQDDATIPTDNSKTKEQQEQPKPEDIPKPDKVTILITAFPDRVLIYWR